MKFYMSEIMQLENRIGACQKEIMDLQKKKAEYSKLKSQINGNVLAKLREGNSQMLGASLNLKATLGGNAARIQQGKIQNCLSDINSIIQQFQGSIIPKIDEKIKEFDKKIKKYEDSIKDYKKEIKEVEKREQEAKNNTEQS